MKTSKGISFDPARVSLETRRRNPHIFGPATQYDNHPDAQVPHPKPEHHETSALGATTQGEAQGIRRTRIRFTGYRVRPLDPDNFAGSVKDLLDGLRHAALIPGDEPWRITLETEQVAVKSYRQERTAIEIEIYEIAP